MIYVDDMEEALAAQDLEAGDPVVTGRAPWYLRWIHTLTFGYFGAKLIAREWEQEKDEFMDGVQAQNISLITSITSGADGMIKASLFSAEKEMRRELKEKVKKLGEDDS